VSRPVSPCSSCKDESVLVVAHRGARYRAPENTLEAFEAALEDGVTAIEFDVLVTADGVPVVCHDDDLRRVSGSLARISQVTSSELAEVDVSRTAIGWGSPVRVPLLSDVLTAFAGRAHLFVELKAVLDSVVGFRSSLLSAEASWPLLRGLEGITVSSFDSAGTSYIHEVSEGKIPIAHSVGALLGSTAYIEVAKSIGARQLHMDKALLGPSTMDAVNESGLEVIAFTVNDPAEAGSLQSLGVHGVFTDEPGPMRAALAG